MVKLRQTQRPAAQASWVEHFYSGAVQVVNGEVELPDNKIDWINQLRGRGYTIIDGEAATPTETVPDSAQSERIEEIVENTEPFEPLGTQTVDVTTEIPSEVFTEETTEDKADGVSTTAKRRPNKSKATKETN
jgi:hypothetical protein